MKRVERRVLLPRRRRLSLTIGVATFEEQMRYLKTRGYRVISLHDFLELASLRRQLPRKSVVLTFDDGWTPFREFAYPILKELGFTATLFIYADFVGSRSALSWDEIRQLGGRGSRRCGHDLCHPARTSGRAAMRSIERRSRRHPGLTDGAPRWGIAASVGEGTPQRSKARPAPRDAGRRPQCRILADLHQARGVGAGVARSVDREGL